MSNEAWIRIGAISEVIMCLLAVAGLLWALHGILNVLLAIAGIASLGLLGFIGWFIFGWAFCELLDRITNWKD